MSDSSPQIQKELIILSSHPEHPGLEALLLWAKDHPELRVSRIVASEWLSISRNRPETGILMICEENPENVASLISQLDLQKSPSGFRCCVSTSCPKQAQVSEWYRIGVSNNFCFPFSYDELKVKLAPFLNSQSPFLNKSIPLPETDIPFWNFVNDALLVHPFSTNGLQPIVQVNQTAVEKYGYTTAEFRNLTVGDLNTAGPVETFELVLKIQQEGPLAFESFHRRKNGTILPVEISSRMIDYKGTPYVLSVVRDISRRMEIQKELNIRQSFLATALQVGKMAYWQYDSGTDEFIFNDEFYGLFGTNAKAEGGYRMKSATYTEGFLYPDDREVLGKHIHQLFQKTKENVYRELTYRILYRNGNTGYMFVRYQVQLKDGKTDVIGICQDITEQKRSELENLDYQRRMAITQMGIDLSNVAVFQVNEKGWIDYVNDYACRYLGYSRDELLSMHVTELDGTMNQQQWENNRKIARESKGLVFESQHICKDGSTIDVEVSVHYFEYKGQLMSFSFVKDLTLQKRQQRHIRESEHRFREILTGTKQIAVTGYDENGNIFFWNQANVGIYGYSPQEAIGKNIIDLIVPGNYRENARVALAKIARKERLPDFGEITLRRKDGSPVTVFSSLTLVNINGRNEFYSLDVDLTKIKEAEKEKERAFQEMVLAKEEAEFANRAKDDFLAVMSHEMRTPLNPIIGFSDLLRSESKAPEKEYLDIIHDSGKRLNILINNILDFIRIGKEKDHPEPVEFKLLELCKSSFSNAEQYKPQLEFRIVNGFVDYREIPDQYRVMADAQYLQRVLDNLLTNACKYTPQGSVTFNIGLDHSHPKNPIFHAEIIDTGIGIDSGMMQNIFKPFTQADKSYSRKSEGVGLGLSICKKLITRLDGKIAVSSTLGKGTKFTIQIPVTPVFEAREIRPEKPKNQWRKLPGNPKVLIVDDILNNSKITGVMISKMNCRYDSADNGRTAVERCQTNPYDLILMDLSMPLMDGFEATRLIRTNEGPNQQTPIVGLSAHVSSSVEEKCLIAGMQGYIEKPIQPQQFQEMLHSLLGNGSSTEETTPGEFR